MITLKNKTVTIELIEIGARINAIVVNGVDIALGFNSQADYEQSESKPITSKAKHTARDYRQSMQPYSERQNHARR